MVLLIAFCRCACQLVCQPRSGIPGSQNIMVKSFIICDQKNSENTLVSLPSVYGSVFVNETLHLSSPRTSFGSVHVNDKIYFGGGYQHHDYVASNIVDVLSLSNNSWSQANLTSARGMVTPVVIAPRIYFVGGVEYTNVPYYYQNTVGKFGTVSNTSIQYTSGPTVRRPIKLALINTTLVAVGAFSVDFMDISTGNWTYNQQLTAIMSTLHSTSTFVYNKHVFVVGGYKIATGEWSSSVWILEIDFVETDPIEYKDQAPEQPILSSTLDAGKNAVVFQYEDVVMVYHFATPKWIMLNETNFISAVTHVVRTIVSFSTGFWVFDWKQDNQTFYAVNQLTFAFSIGEQFVHSSQAFFTFGGIVVRGLNLDLIESIPTLASLQGTGFVLSIIANPSVFGAVGTNGVIYSYNSTTRLFSEASTTVQQPLDMFTNTASFFVNSVNPAPAGGYKLITVSTTANTTSSKVVPFRVSVLVGKTFIDLNTGATTTTLEGVTEDEDSGARFSRNCVWVQSGTTLFVMESNTLDGPPVAGTSVPTIDVYNYMEDKWEEPIEISPSPSFIGYIQAAAINGSLVIFTPQNTSIFDPTTSKWRYEAPAPSFSNLLHPTFASVPVIGGTAYLRNNDSGITAVTLPGTFAAKSIQEFVTASRQIVMYEEKLLFLAATQPNGQYSNVFYFNVAEDRFQSTLGTAQSDLRLATYDDFLLALGANSTKIDYFYIKNGLWGFEDMENSFLPSTVQQIKVINSSTLLVTAGGYHREFFYFTDGVKILTLNLTVPTVAEPVAPYQAPVEGVGIVPNMDANANTIIIAVVVPVGALISGVILAVLLTRRNKKKKNQITTNELENRYGQWFTPFSELNFGPQLGQGANGQVFSGTWKGTKVALKVSPALANSGVISELEVMINMRPHPNVIQLFGFSIHPETNSVILIIEYCDGGSLDSVLYEPKEPITFEQKLAWIQGAARGLNHLHSNNIVHRDVAARNILLHQNEPKLTDFGMSRFVDEDQKGTTRSELGPIRWMAPESLKSKQYSNKSDVWSFGILMYEILVQQEPHHAADPINIARQIRDQGLVPTIPPDCPSEIAAVMQKCWQIDPDMRPKMGQIADIL